METDNKQINALKVGIYSSIFMTILTIITFGFAIIAIPPSGPYCPGNCMGYPYSDILSYYPRDYYWMYFAVFQIFAYLIFIISNHFIATEEKKIFSFISFSFAMITAVILLADYFIQFTVVPISVMKGQTEGISLLTQYNGQGIFIAMEELGFISMSLSFLFLAPVYSTKTRLEKVIRWMLILPFVLILFSFVYYSIRFGLDRDYRFEVAAITINWLAAIIAGILIGLFFKRKMSMVK